MNGAAAARDDEGGMGAQVHDGGAEDGRLTLAPFRGLRYAAEHVSDLGAVTTPPYDLVDDPAQLRERDPYNAVRLILPRASDPAQRYAAAMRLLRRWTGDAVLVRDDEPALYVYEQVLPGPHGGLRQRGLIGALGIGDRDGPAVLPHEEVSPEPVADRARLIAATGSNLEPIYLLYDGGSGGRRGAASRLTDETADTLPPLLRADTPDGAVHRIWRLTEPARLAAVAEDLARRRALLADGHHRYAAYRIVRRAHRAAGHGPGPWDRGLALLVDSTAHPPLLGAIHRVLPGLPPDRAAAEAARVCQVKRIGADPERALAALAAAAGQGPAFLLADGAAAYLATGPDPLVLRAAYEADGVAGRSARWRRLETAVLDHLLLPRVWHLAEAPGGDSGRAVPGADRAVRLVHDDASTALRTARRLGGTAVVLPALTVAAVREVAAAGERTPRKSTSFGPKPRSGLVIRLID
ncbi:DUF1015 domain-containing protein [Allonocardiopsis opalescens]|uniref:DUF1015 domain-containing protein n=1 Tax=Allonocardiopsis opalescens TaxID=1144618 RepID=UPI001FED19EA|nr:DUF1015 domain-containing protein [Allonocardiopsis opalescens]